MTLILAIGILQDRHMNDFRLIIDFNGKVKRIFDFLIREEGFNLVTEDVTFIRYESHLVFINFYHGRSSYELGVEMGLLVEEDTVFRLPTIIAALAPDYTGQVVFQAGEPKIVEECLLKISALIKKYCVSLLNGDKTEWTKVSIQQQLNSQKLHEEYTINPVKEDAERAWKEKRYKDVVKLYSSVEHYLTNTEKKRLEYAKKQE